MTRRLHLRRILPWQAFGVVFIASVVVGATVATPPKAAQAQEGTPEPTPAAQTRYNGPDFCGNCHGDIHEAWQTTRHAQAFSSPVFQQDWQDLGNQFACLGCHTTGYDPASNSYAA